MDRIVPRNRGQFQKGMPRPKGAGRRKGTPNKHTTDTREMLRQAASDVGYKEWQDKVEKGKIVGKIKVLGKDGELGFLRYMADEHPVAFFAAYAKAFIPHYITAPPEEPTETVVYGTIAEMEQAMIEDGIPLDPKIVEHNAREEARLPKVTAENRHRGRYAAENLMSSARRASARR
jgi:hypothetical protein